MKKVMGVILIVLAVLLLGWVGYNLIEPQPEAEGLSVIPPLLFSAGLIYVGQKWIRGRSGKNDA